MHAPFVWIVVCFSAGILCKGLIFPSWMLLPVFVLALVTLRYCGLKLAWTCQCVFICLVGMQIAQNQESEYFKNPLRLQVAEESREPVLIRGSVIRTPEFTPEFFVLYLHAHQAGIEKVDGVIRLTVSGTAPILPRFGDEIETYATLRLPSNFLTEGAFDFERYMRKEGVHLIGSIKNPVLIHIVRRGTSWKSFISEMRLKGIRKISRFFSPEVSGLLRALWLDDRIGLSGTQEQQLIDEGIFHVIAISGFHIAVVLAIGFLFLKYLVRYKIALVILAALLFFYFQILEGRSSVTRSFIAFGTLFLATFLKERPPLENVLAFAALLQLLLNPLELFDSGFHLTYLSTAIILFVVPRVCAVVRLPRPLYQCCFNFLLAIFLVQWILIPYQALVFHRIPFGSIFANAFAIPYSSLLIALAPLWIILQEFWAGAAGCLEFLVRLFLNGIVIFNGLWMRVLPVPSVCIVAAFYGFLIVSIASRNPVVKALCLLMCVLGLFVIVFPRSPASHPYLRLHVIDVGQGDSILIEYPDGTFDLIDGGGFWNREALDTGASVLLPYLTNCGVRKLHRVFLTHAHSDHMNGLISTLRYFPVAEFYVTRLPYGDSGFRAFLNQVNRKPLNVLSGQKFRQGKVLLEILSPPDSSRTKRVANGDSLVMMIQYEGKRILLTGDIEAASENILSSARSIQADFLKIPHHGSRFSSTAVFLDQVHAKVALISAGRENWFGHPHPETLARLRSHKIMIRRTDLDGTIRLSIGKNVSLIDAYGWNQ